ncbi:hypothetical protein WR164_01110 [Philodulcilactobacillus myokoensis]|uniref:Uncharacterized protein n=1 Tax=Philodulcilactobacillus myokoensis TaxID=2929573 RepID=A0A9W6ES19_9LACO|nr:hypothetical protein [Philodulcilactobacillus myokoensis]GLB46132.1 hypothetical protein WR164_01110 [Philodulcilactobacillus myokoensis]
MFSNLMGMFAILLAVLFLISAFMTVHYALKRNRIILNNPKSRSIIDQVVSKYPLSRQQSVEIQNVFHLNMLEAFLLLRRYKRY